MSTVYNTASLDDRSRAADGDWHLESLISGTLVSVPLTRMPFRVGRHPNCDLYLPAAEVSRRHAEILEHSGELWIRECGSTNGTFINRERLHQASTLKSGDVIQFGTMEFRLWHRTSAAPAIGPDASPTLTHVVEDADSADTTMEFGLSRARFDEMLRQRSVVPFFQPLTNLTNHSLVGYELLGRCDFDGLPRDPMALLDLANTLDKDVELSELFREVGLQQAASLGNCHALFLNAAATEIEPFRLALSLTTLRHHSPELPLILEINEAAVTSRRMLINLRSLLNDLEVELAYDDFGVGQARLLELIEVPPDWLKFDIMLIHSMRHLPDPTRKVLDAMITMARDLGIKTVAEGIENSADLQICQELGFDVAQGYFIGRPLPFFALAGNYPDSATFAVAANPQEERLP